MVSSLRLVGLATLALLAACADVADDAAPEETDQVAQALNPNGPAEPPDPEGTPVPSPSPAPAPEYVTIGFRGLSFLGQEDDIFGTSYWHQLYGSMSVRNLTWNTSSVRNLGAWGNPTGRASVGWTSSDGAAPKNFNADWHAHSQPWNLSPMYEFASVKLCSSSSYAYCNGPFAYNNNVVTLGTRSGDRLRVDFDFRDYDAISDDQICYGSIDILVGSSTMTVNGIKYHSYKARPWGSTGAYQDFVHSIDGNGLEGACKFFF